uniref:hypothetical protein n=1 Tax=Sphingomonas bacterium TaxID=1895847 RepID=UPI00262D90D4|nr:hypothetical protein [Sphingomonas bacterium]
MRSLSPLLFLVLLCACERRVDIVHAQRDPDVNIIDGVSGRIDRVAQLRVEITQDSFRMLAGRSSPVNFILYRCEDPDGRRTDTKLSVGGTLIRGLHRDWPTQSQWRAIEKADMPSGGAPVTILVQHTADLLDGEGGYLCGHFERDFIFDPFGTAKLSSRIRFPRIRNATRAMILD